MRSVVADASALVEYLLGSKRSARAARIVEERDVDLHTAALCDVELVSALRGLVRGGEIDVARALQIFEDYADLPIARHGHVLLMTRALELRDNFSAYDATYVALAEALGAELLTCDARLEGALARHAAGVKLREE